MSRQSTAEAILLKSALEKHGVIVEAEKWDGHKHIDLVIHRARLNIEVDGMQHYTDPKQIVADLKRSHYSDFRGYDTIHIPNLVIRDYLELVAEGVAEAAQIRARKLGHRFHYRERVRN